MTKETEPATGVRTLPPQDRADFVRTQQVLQEQLSRTQAMPAPQVRMRLVLWIVRTGLETNRADFALLDRLCQHQERGNSLKTMAKMIQICGGMKNLSASIAHEPYLRVVIEHIGTGPRGDEAIHTSA
jgi:hypothetical protein